MLQASSHWCFLVCANSFRTKNSGSLLLFSIGFEGSFCSMDLSLSRISFQSRSVGTREPEVMLALRRAWLAGLVLGSAGTSQQCPAFSRGIWRRSIHTSGGFLQPVSLLLLCSQHSLMSGSLGVGRSKKCL